MSARRETPRVEPKRIFALDEGRFVVSGIHSGRSLKMGLEVEVEVIWLFTYDDDVMRRWDMFLSLDDALEAASR